MFRRSKSIVGLDLGSSVVKAIELSLEGPEPVITGFNRVEIAQGSNLDEAVDTLLREGKFKSKKVVTAVSGQSVVVRYVPMMKMSDVDLKQAIRFEADKYLPFDLDEVQLDCQGLERVSEASKAEGDVGEGELMTVLLAACKTAAIERNTGKRNFWGYAIGGAAIGGLAGIGAGIPVWLAVDNPPPLFVGGVGAVLGSIYFAGKGIRKDRLVAVETIREDRVLQQKLQAEQAAEQDQINQLEAERAELLKKLKEKESDQ